MIPCPGVMMIHLTYLHEFADQRGSRDEFSPRCRKDQAAIGLSMSHKHESGYHSWDDHDIRWHKSYISRI